MTISKIDAGRSWELVDNGNFKFERIAEDKPINIMNRRPIE